jgi:peptidoglycan/xylan/chitin deacetylase (PgdA/CDA1 family)
MKVRRVARWLGAHLENGGVILMYHRIADLPSDPWGLAVTPRHFAQQLAVLRQRYSPISLRELVGSLGPRRLPKRAVAITFDDGYTDNLHIAKPVMEKFDIPATVFITTGHVGRSSPFWWDDLDRVILQARHLPGHLKIQIGQATHQWDLSDAQRAREAEDLLRSWRAWNKPPAESREALFVELYGLLDPLPSDAKHSVVGRLKEWAGISTAADDYGVVTSEDIVDLGKGGLVDIGAHTISHSRLGRLSLERQRHEIRGSQAALEKILGRAVTSFAYPHGLRTDYTRDTVAAVRETGFDHACAAYSGIVTSASERFELPRCAVPDLEAHAFQAWLLRLRSES